MLFRMGMFAGVMLAVALATAPTPAAAQAACAADDLKCRIERIEARLGLVETKASAAQTAVTAATAPKPIEIVRAWQQCRGNTCAAEATKICTSSGFASGKPKDWQRERNGMTFLVSAECVR
jgi:hypothetical protein